MGQPSSNKSSAMTSSVLKTFAGLFLKEKGMLLSAKLDPAFLSHVAVLIFKLPLLLSLLETTFDAFFMFYCE